MPLLFFGRIKPGRRQIFAPGLRPVETTVFDKWRIRHLAPSSEVVGLANYWWFEDRKHTAISWTDNRVDIEEPCGIKDNEGNSYEQTIFIPGLISSMIALEIARTEFPKWLVPSPILFRFNNPDKAYLYD